MALQLKVSLQQQDSCNTLVMYDISGTYDAVANTTGWKTVSSGSTNIQIDNSSITEAKILVSIGGLTSTFDLMTTAVWRLLTLYTTGTPFDSATTPATLQYTIPGALLISGTSSAMLNDGIITIVYYIKDTNGTEVTNVFTIAVYCKTRSRYYKLIARIPDYYNGVHCSNAYVDMAMTISGMYEALKLSACSADVDKFNSILASLNTIFDTLQITY